MRIYSESSEVITHWQWHDGALRNIGDVILSFIPRNTTRVLDVGCGSGRLIAQIVRAGFDEVLGIDIESDVIELGRSILNREGINAKLAVCNLLTESLPDFENQFDVITCAEVLEHVADWSMLVQRISSLLRPGGRLIISVPRDPRQFSVLDEYADHLRRFRDTEILNELENSEFHCLKVRYLGWPFMRSIVGVYSFLHKVLGISHEKTTQTRWGNESGIHALANNIFYLCLKVDNLFSFCQLGTTLVVSAEKPLPV